MQRLDEYIGERHTRDLFRLATLARYDAASGDLWSYLRGDDGPNAAARRPWLDRLRADTAAGRSWRRVHTIRQPLSDYLRYACECCYADNVANGEDVRILDVDEAGLDRFVEQVGDFIVIDHQHVVRSRYDDHGRFVYAEEPADPGPYVALADLIWHAADPFPAWWADHPQYHRGGAPTARPVPPRPTQSGHDEPA